MRKVISLSALVSGLLASPMLAAVPREQETANHSALVSPADANPVAQLHALLQAGPADIGGMRGLQRRMVANVQDQLAELLADGPAVPQPAPLQMAPLEKAAFLGVTTSPASDTLRQQLGLAEGMGLVVDFVAKDSPAQAAGLQVHDVLQKLDDQLLINPAQLAVLVRSKKAGDTIDLIVIREARPVQLKATLIEREMTTLQNPAPPALLEIPGAGREMNLQTYPPLTPSDAGGAWLKQTQTHVTLNPDGSSTTTLTDDTGEITLKKAKDGTTTVTAADKTGKEIYTGPFTTEEDRKKAPPDVANKIAGIHVETPTTQLKIGTANPYHGGVEIHSGTLIYRADDACTILLSIGNDKDKTMSATIKDAHTGKVIYDGSANTADDFQKMPPALAAKVKAMEQKVTAK